MLCFFVLFLGPLSSVLIGEPCIFQGPGNVLDCQTVGSHQTAAVLNDLPAVLLRLVCGCTHREVTVPGRGDSEKAKGTGTWGRVQGRQDRSCWESLPEESHKTEFLGQHIVTLSVSFVGQGSSLETQCAGFPSGASHADVLYLVQTHVSEWEASRCFA